MRRLLITIVSALSLVNVLSLTSAAEDSIYEGVWHTTNRKLDGTMTCVVTDLGSEKWRGRFHGVWQGVAFDYTVAFSGPPSDLHGTAQIDGADYTWKGKLGTNESGAFSGNFGGSRYEGYFDLKKKATAIREK
jgi:hypothetical protein